VAPLIAIERLGERDVDALRALAVATFVEAFGFSFTPADLAAHLAKHLARARFERALVEDDILAAFAGDRLIGFAQFGALRLAVDRPAGQGRELRRLHVHANHRNSGVGARLMTAALAAMRAAGAAEFYRDVWEPNAGARRFYERHGFEVVGALDFVVESGARTTRDLIMVRRQLP
jgi:ribosomal protein S18 acetylase RimI-like enzyme